MNVATRNCRGSARADLAIAFPGPRISKFTGKPLRSPRFYTSPHRLHSECFNRLSPLKGERIKVRGFQLKRVPVRTFTLALSLAYSFALTGADASVSPRPGERREKRIKATPLQLLASTDLVRTRIHGR